MSLRIGFAGTPEFAAAHLKQLIDAGFNILGVWTQPDRPKGRGKKLQASPVKQLALDKGLEVYQPLNFKDPASIEQMACLQLDYLIVVAYGLILPQEVLDLPKYDCINVHASLLPRWRGAAPIQRCILAGDAKTGVCIMQMEKGLDTGAVYLREECTINPDETTTSLTEKLTQIGKQLLSENLAKLSDITPLAQDDAQACYAEKIQKSEAELDFSLNAKANFDKVRVFEPAWFMRGEQRIRVWQAIWQDLGDANPAKPTGEILAINAKGILVQCGENSALLIEKLQLAGGKALLVKDLLNGKKLDFVIGESIYG